MDIAIISYHSFFSNEAKYINLLFSSGIKTLHLRKPNADKALIENIINEINPQYHNRIVLHNHYEFIANYGLKGAHFGKKTEHLISKYFDKNFTNSFSCHSTNEIDNLEKDYDYVFLSPVFNSISKKNYKSEFCRDKLKMFLQNNRKHKVYALGGVSKDNIHEVKKMGFDGFAILGDLWCNCKTDSDFKEYVNKIMIECS